MEMTYALLVLGILLTAVAALNVKSHGWKRGLILTVAMMVTAVILITLVTIFEPWGLLVIALILLVVVVFFL